MKTDYYGVIYKITNLVNGKIYIGQSKNYKTRWRQHKWTAKNNKKRKNSLIAKSIYKYSEENFSFEVIDKAFSPEELNILEEKYIRDLNCIAPHGYNLVAINEGIRTSNKITLDKITKAKLNKKNSNSSSIYYGVCKESNNKHGYWRAMINFKSKTIRLGSFLSETDAAKARDIEVLKHKYGGIFELNFPELKDKYLNNEIKIEKLKKRRESKYHGVSFGKKHHKWISTICYNGKQLYLGSFDTEELAAKYYDIKTIEYYGNNTELNFPELRNQYLNGDIVIVKNKSVAELTRMSDYIGVGFDRTRNKWTASIRYEGKKKYIGRFLSEMEAALAYDKKAIELFGDKAKTNF